MENTAKQTNKARLIIAVILIAVIALGVAAYFIFRKQLVLDETKGRLAHSRTESAQYMPDINKLIEQSVSGATQSSNTITASALDSDNFFEIIETLSKIDGEGCGKYQGYDIYEIKEEIAFVLKTVPAFNQWFRIGTMREQQGFVEWPYYEGWAYYLECDELAKDITITRVCWATRFSYWDFAKGKEVEDYNRQGNESIIQYQIMQTKYYFDENDKEVVECFVYTVAVDHVKTGTGTSGYYNGDTKNYKPVSVQYMKNIKDTSLTKYSITIAERTSDGWDIRGKNPYGSTREFIQLDYTDANNIKMLKISQTLPVTGLYNKPATTNIAFYNKTQNDIEVYTSCHDYFKSEGSSFAYSLNDSFTDYISAGIINIEKCFVQSYLYNGKVNSGSGVLSSNAVTRAIKNYQSDDEQSLMQALFTSLGSLAAKVGVNNSTIIAFISDASVNSTVESPDCENENLIDSLMTKISRAAIEKLEIKNDWPLIFKESDGAPEVEMKGDFYDKDLPITYLNSTAEIEANGICYASGYAEVLSNSIKNSGNQTSFNNYSLSLALRSSSGNIIILATQYTDNRYANINSPEILADYTIDLKTVNIEKEGSYALVWVLTKKQDGEDVIICDTKVSPLLLRYRPFTIADTVNDGIVSSYEVTGKAKRLIIAVTTQDI